MEAKLVGTGSSLIVFLHGWPDTGDLWKEQVEVLQDKYRCLILTLPLYRVKDSSVRHSWGPNFDECALLMEREIRKVQRDESDKAILCVHDWGSYTGFTCMDKFPKLFKGLIAMDVGPPYLDKAKLIDMPLAIGVGLLYQYILVVAFVISRTVPVVGWHIGNYITKALALILKGYLKNPALDVVSVNMNYPYYHFHVNYFKELLFGGTRTIVYSKHRDETPEVPTLYFYGRIKPVQFHTSKFLSGLRKREDCEVVPLNTLHWLTDSHGKEINQKIIAFLEKNVA